MKIYRNYLVIITVALVACALMINVFLSNKKVLFTLAMISDDPSSVRSFALERIYKMSENDNFRKEILDQLLKNIHTTIRNKTKLAI